MPFPDWIAPKSKIQLNRDQIWDLTRSLMICLTSTLTNTLDYPGTVEQAYWDRIWLELIFGLRPKAKDPRNYLSCWSCSWILVWSKFYQLPPPCYPWIFYFLIVIISSFLLFIYYNYFYHYFFVLSINLSICTIYLYLSINNPSLQTCGPVSVLLFQNIICRPGCWRISWARTNFGSE